MVKIRMVDSTCFGNWHLHFNSQLIEILSNIASVVEYRGAQNIGNSKLNIKRRKLFVITGSGKLRIILRFLFTLMNDVWQVIIVPNDEIIVYCFDATVSVRAVNMINKIVKKKVIMFRHGSMEMLQTSPSGKGIFYRFEYNLVKQFFLNKNLNISTDLHFFVLGDVILKNLSVFLSKDKVKHFHSIDHPYNFDRNALIKERVQTSKLYIGTVGVFNEYKGGADLLQLAQILKRKALDDINISISGKIEFDISLLQDAEIDLPSNGGKEMVSVEELKDRIDKLDYILYFYPVNTYRLTASGAIFDAITRKRPIIALRNDYFEYIFNKFGSIGYLVDSVSEMADIIYRISNGVEKRVDYDFEQIQDLLSVDNLTKIFAEQLREIGFIKK